MSQGLGIAGYAIYRKGELKGTPGSHYTYVMAGNGLLVGARNELLTGVVVLAPAEVRGLMPTRTGVQLYHGKIPAGIYRGVLILMGMDRQRELYLAVTWEEGKYNLRMPSQERSAAGVTYEKWPNTVLELHSHPGFPASFSATE